MNKEIIVDATDPVHNKEQIERFHTKYIKDKYRLSRFDNVCTHKYCAIYYINNDEENINCLSRYEYIRDLIPFTRKADIFPFKQLNIVNLAKNLNIRSTMKFNIPDRILEIYAETQFLSHFNIKINRDVFYFKASWSGCPSIIATVENKNYDLLKIIKHFKNKYKYKEPMKLNKRKYDTTIKMYR